MKYFDKDYLDFFKELERNNNKDWFDANRKRYETSIKIPFKGFMTDLAASLQPFYKGNDLGDKWSVMRINRDIRFSADKTPYKIHMGGMVNPGGKKVKHKPGFFVQANHKDIRVYSGAHSLDKDGLYAVRDHISHNLKQFNKLVNDKKWKEIYSEILGEKNKRLPSEFQEVEKSQPLIANKNFYWYFKLKPAVITSNDLIDQLTSRYQKTLPLNKFFTDALKGM